SIVSFQTSPEDAKPGMNKIFCFPFPIFSTLKLFSFVCPSAVETNATKAITAIKMFFKFITNSSCFPLDMISKRMLHLFLKIMITSEIYFYKELKYSKLKYFFKPFFFCSEVYLIKYYLCFGSKLL